MSWYRNWYGAWFGSWFGDTVIAPNVVSLPITVIARRYELTITARPADCITVRARTCRP